jgi:hypothetical protein
VGAAGGRAARGAGEPARTPNPSKAPWYFLGLQEMLVFFDPWHAGVVLPSLIIVGLMVIPYIDINPAGNGYYCFRPRMWEILTFYLGFHILWVSLIIIGTFVRGPGWNWFWFWEKWDPHKVESLTNVDLPYSWAFATSSPPPSSAACSSWPSWWADDRVLLHVQGDQGGRFRRVHGPLGLGALRAHRLPGREHVGVVVKMLLRTSEHQVHHVAQDAYFSINI